MYKNIYQCECFKCNKKFKPYNFGVVYGAYGKERVCSECRAVILKELEKEENSEGVNYGVLK